MSVANITPLETNQAIVPMDIARAKTVASRVADICEECAVKLSGKKYLKVEGWQSIAAEDGCCPEVDAIEYIEAKGNMPSGVRAHAVLKRVSDGAILSRAYGFVGTDEQASGPARFWYAKEGKAQTRAVSRVCRHRYAYVLVLMNRGFETTPFEEMDLGGDDKNPSRKPLPKRKNTNQAGDEKAAYQVITGEVANPQTSEFKDKTYYFIEVGEDKLMTSDSELGADLMAAAGLTIEARCVNRTEKGPHHWRIISFHFVEGQEEDEQAE